MIQGEGFTYAETGVDVDVEEKAANILFTHAKETWPNREGKIGSAETLQGGFSGLRFSRIGGLPDGTVEWGNVDGVGTKPEIVKAADRYDTIATDLIAMVADDAAIKGAEPAHIETILVVNTLGQDESRLHYIDDLGRGYVKAAKEAGVAIINGEIAQHSTLGGDISQFFFDWGAEATWYAHESRLLDGSAVQPGDYIVGLREDGLRCNGISAVRKALETRHGLKWGDTDFEGQRLADVALTPSRIYSGAIVDMTGGYDLDRTEKAKLHGAAHVTGSGIPGKLGRLLIPSGLGAIIDNPYEPSNLMKYCQGIAQMKDYEAYRTWCMGQGMLLISQSPEDVMAVAFEHGIESKVVGRITDDSHITINSAGIEGGSLVF